MKVNISTIMNMMVIIDPRVEMLFQRIKKSG